MLAASILQIPYPLMPEITFPSRAMLGLDCSYGAGEVQARFADLYSEYPRTIDSPIILNTARDTPEFVKRFAKMAFDDGLSIPETISSYNISTAILTELCTDRPPQLLSAKTSVEARSFALKGLRYFLSAAQSTAMPEFVKSGAIVRKEIPNDNDRASLPFNCRSHLLMSLLPEKVLKAHDISTYEFMFANNGLLEEIMLKDFHPVPTSEQPRQGDIVFYSETNYLHRMYPANHYARVIAVDGGQVWVEAKWGYVGPTVAAPVQVMAPEYGTYYFLARHNSSSPNFTQSSFEDMGFRIARQAPLTISNLSLFISALLATIQRKSR